MYLRIQPDSPGNTSLHHYNNTLTANNVESQEVSLKVISCYCELYNPRQHGQTPGLFPCYKYIPFFFFQVIFFLTCHMHKTWKYLKV